MADGLPNILHISQSSEGLNSDRHACPPSVLATEPLPSLVLMFLTCWTTSVVQTAGLAIQQLCSVP